jgi:hypothetical protein
MLHCYSILFICLQMHDYAQGKRQIIIRAIIRISLLYHHVTVPAAGTQNSTFQVSFSAGTSAPAVLFAPTAN